MLESRLDPRFSEAKDMLIQHYTAMEQVDPEVLLLW